MLYRSHSVLILFRILKTIEIFFVMIFFPLNEERTYILPSIFGDCFYDYILYIGNSSWNKEVYSEENDLDSISSKGENNDYKQNQNVSYLKQKQQAIDNLIEIRRTYKNNPIIGYWLYVLIMSRTRFRVNQDSLVAWMSRNYLLETDAKSEVKVPE